MDKALAPSFTSAVDAKKYADRFLDVRSTVRSASGDTIAAVDEYGRLKLARYRNGKHTLMPCCCVVL